MKKLLAFLLALLLPGMASAESRELSVSVDVDEEFLGSYIKQALQTNPDVANIDLDTLNAAIVHVLDGLGFDILVQDDALQTKLYLGGGELLNLTFYVDADNVYLTSPMFSGYTLETEAPALGDLSGLHPKTAAAAVKWFASLQPTVMSGVFNGDAFEGGTECTTWVLTDKDIVGLVSVLASDEVRNALSGMLDVMGQSGADILAAFDQTNDQVASANAYTYVLRVIRNNAGEFVGASLTVLNQNVQVATVSLGLTKQSITLVAGLGVREQNYWWEFSGQTSQVNDVTQFNGIAREWLADKSEAFSYVSATNAPLAEYRIDATLTELDSSYLWEGAVCVGNETAYEYLCSSKGEWTPDGGALDGSFSIGSAPNEPVKLNIHWGKGESIAPMDKSLQCVSASEPADAEQYQTLMNKFAASILARMIKLLPMDLLLPLNQVLPQ